MVSSTSPQILDSKEIFRGRIFEVTVDTIREGEKTYQREVVHHPGSAVIIPVFGDGTIALVRQYRHPAVRYLLEAPAGTLKRGEVPEEGAARELEEELGVVAARLDKLSEFFVSPGFCEEKMWVYLATELTESRQQLEDDEILEVVRIPFSQALSMITTGEIEDAKTIIGVMLAAPGSVLLCWKLLTLQSECGQHKSASTAFPIDPFRTTSYTPVTVPNPDETIALPTLEDPVPTSPRQAEYQYQYPDPNNPAWGIGGALLVWIASIVLIVLMPVFFLLPYAWARGLHSGMPNYWEAITEFALTDKTAVLLQVVSLFPSHLLTLLLVWALVTRFGKQSFWPAIGWGWAPSFRLWKCIGLGTLLFIVGAVIAKVLGGDKPTQLEQIINSSLLARYIISFLAVGTAPFVEEFVYRGVLYAPLQRLAGVPGAVVIVLALFTLIHVPQYWPNFGVIAAVALLSIVLTVVRAYSGRLLPCIVIHLVFNGIQAVILLVEPHLQPLIPSAERAAPAASFLLSLIGSLI